jgi:hypothetical protein
MTALSSDQRVDSDKLGQFTGLALPTATEVDFTALFPDCEAVTLP